jgi:hypothetical protein
METIESYFMDLANKTGQTNFGTPEGLAFVTTESRCGVEDFNKVIEFAKEHDAWHLITKGVSKNAVKDYLDEHNQLPPGVNFTTRKVIQIRRK